MMNIVGSFKRCYRFSLAMLSALILVNTAGCSTISFFPTESAQKAADKVIDDIWPAADPMKMNKDMKDKAKSGNSEVSTK